MNSIKSIEIIYLAIKAKSTVKAIVSNILDDLEVEGLDIFASIKI